MPKSKRNKQIELSKTKKRGLEWKKGLFEEVRSSVDKYANVFVFLVNDMRNSKMKSVREQWRHSRFFIGKNKIMAMSLGRSAEEEYKPNLHKLGQQIKGQCGLLFSNKSTEEVLSWFRSYSEGDYARSGNTATETVNLTQGPLAMFPHNLEPYLRQLGLPTTLVKGVIHLIKDHEVCKAGDVLSPETAKILKLLGYEMAEFHLTIACVWSQDGSFMQFVETIDTDAKENKKKARKSSFKSKSAVQSNLSILEKMEVEINTEGNSDESEDEIVTNAPETKQDVSESFIIDAVPFVSAPKEKSNGLVETIDTDAKENKKKARKSSFNSKSAVQSNLSILEKMEVEINTEGNSDESEDEIVTNASETKQDVSESFIIDAVPFVSTPKEKSNGFVENSVSDLHKDDKKSIECKMDDIVKTVDDNEHCEKEGKTKVSDLQENGKNSIGCKIDDDDDDVEIVHDDEYDEKEDKIEVSDLQEDDKNSIECKIGDDNELGGKEDKIEVSDLQQDDKNSIECKTGDDNELGGKENKIEYTEQSHLDTTTKTPKNKKKEKTKRESLLKTPDANTSQDSPVFRQLRNRSVKVNRKRK